MMKSQRGAVLMVSLVFLLLLSLLAVSSMQNATLQEKVSGSLRLRDASFQLAEGVLRTAEANLLVPGFSLVECATPRACMPPPEALTLSSGRTGSASGVTWVVSGDGFYGLQYLGQIDGAVTPGASSQSQRLYRVTAIGIHGSARTVLESIHTQERRIMWRQRL